MMQRRFIVIISSLKSELQWDTEYNLDNFINFLFYFAKKEIKLVHSSTILLCIVAMWISFSNLFDFNPSICELIGLCSSCSVLCGCFKMFFTSFFIVWTETTRALVIIKCSSISNLSSYDRMTTTSMFYLL